MVKSRKSKLLIKQSENEIEIKKKLDIGAWIMIGLIIVATVIFPFFFKEGFAIF